MIQWSKLSGHCLLKMPVGSLLNVLPHSRPSVVKLGAKQALMDAKEKHARRWQTKEGTYRLKEKLLPDVRDTDVEMVDSSSAHQQTDHSESACAW